MTKIEVKAREKFGSLRQLALALGLTPPAVHQVTAGYRKPWPKLRTRLTEALGVPECELFASDGWPIKTDESTKGVV